MDQRDFLAAKEAALRDSGIGTLGEKSVHAVLKAAYEPHGENREVAVGGYVADILGEDGIMEIQTRALWRLREKLQAFLPVCPVTVVYPVYPVEWILRTNPDTGEVTRRRSSKKGRGSDVLAELYPLREFLTDPGFHLRVVELVTQRWDIGKARGKKQHLDREPLEFLHEWVLEQPEDYRELIPAGLPEEFTAEEFGKALHLRKDGGWKALATLTVLGLVEQIGKSGRRNLYRLTKEGTE